MKAIIRNSVVVLLVAVLMLTFIVLPSNALDFEKDTFIIDGTYYSDISKDLNGNGWSFDASEFKLTLDGYDSSLILFCPAVDNSKILNIVLKNTNTVEYNIAEVNCPIYNSKNYIEGIVSEHSCYFCRKITGIAALYVQNCGVNLSGGTLNVKAIGYGASAVFFSKDSIIENTTLNCTAGYISLWSFRGLTIKNSTINMDSERAFSTDVVFDGCKITYKNSDIYNKHHELLCSGGELLFKNSTFEITVGARALDSKGIVFSGFQGSATCEFDNTVLKVKQGPHNNPNNSSVLFSLGYPELENNRLTIKNNSRFEMDECIECAFSANQINISDSTIVGTLGRNFAAAAKLNITNSDIDIVGKGEETDVFIEAEVFNVKNSKLKCKTNGYIWVNNQWFDFSNEKKLTLIDSQIDFSGNVDKFGEKWTLEYTTPEKWMVILDGVKSELSINSANLDIRHESLVIKIDENYKPNQSKPTTTTTTTPNQNISEIIVSTPETDNSSLTNETSSVDTGNQLSSQNNNEQETGNTIGSEAPVNNSEKNTANIVLIITLCVLAVIVVGVVTFIYIYKKKNNKTK